MADRIVLSNYYYEAKTSKIYHYENSDDPSNLSHLKGYLEYADEACWPKAQLDEYFEKLFQEINTDGQYSQITDFVWNIKNTMKDLNLAWDLKPASLLMFVAYKSNGLFFHAGDLRAYSFYNNNLHCLSKEHNRENELIDSGIMNSIDAKSDLNAKTLTKYVGFKSIEDLVDVTKVFNLYEGQKLFVCSKEIYENISDTEIISFIKENNIEGLVTVAQKLSEKEDLIAEIVEIRGTEKAIESKDKKNTYISKIMMAVAVLVVIGVGTYFGFNRIQEKVAQVYDTEQEKQQEQSDVNVVDNTKIEIKDDTNKEIESIDGVSDVELVEPKPEVKPEPEPEPKPEVKPEPKPKPKPEPEPEPEPKPEVKPTETELKTYALQKGETLYSVSTKFYGNADRIEDIMKINNISDVSSLSVGQVLKLPN